MDNNNDNDFEQCEECECIINCQKDNIFIITKGEQEKVWCQFCFEDLWRDAAKEGWSGDDIEENLEQENKKKKKNNKNNKNKKNKKNV